MDTFGHTGIPANEFNSTNIKFHADVLYSTFKRELNHAYYSSVTFQIAFEIFQNKYHDQDAFVEHELRSLSRLIKWVKQCFDFHKIELNNIDFRQDAPFPNNPNDTTKTYFGRQFNNDVTLMKLAEMYASFVKTSAFLNSKLTQKTTIKKPKTPSLKTGFEFLHNEQMLRDIYFKLRVDVLHDDTSCEDFVQVLTEDWKIHQSVIKFQCTNAMAAALIDWLKPKFDNLNRNEAERSKKFQSRRGKILEHNNLSASISNSKKDNKLAISQILT